MERFIEDTKKKLNEAATPTALKMRCIVNDISIEKSVYVPKQNESSFICQKLLEIIENELDPDSKQINLDIDLFLKVGDKYQWVELKRASGTDIPFSCSALHSGIDILDTYRNFKMPLNFEELYDEVDVSFLLNDSFFCLTWSQTVQAQLLKVRQCQLL